MDALLRAVLRQGDSAAGSDHQGASALQRRFPFLPLLVTSVYCAVGMTYVWARLYAHALCGDAASWEDATSTRDAVLDGDAGGKRRNAR